MTAAHCATPQIRRDRPALAPDPARPLKRPQRERFAQLIAGGMPTVQAYRAAGFRGGDKPRWELRNASEVDRRIEFLVGERVKAQTAASARPEKRLNDARARLVRELERLAYSDLGQLAAWGTKAIENGDGSIEIIETASIVDSDKLTPAQRAAIKTIRHKSGKVQIELHDKLGALLSLAKVLGLMPEKSEPQPAPLTVNQVNVGEMNSLEAIKRIAFVIGLMKQREAIAASKREPDTIDATPTSTPDS
jgi:hypothetical protein